MTSGSIKDCPTVTTCRACKGKRTRSPERLSAGPMVETCSWCEGCGFMWPERLEEWEAFSRDRDTQNF